MGGERGIGLKGRKCMYGEDIEDGKGRNRQAGRKIKERNHMKGSIRVIENCSSISKLVLWPTFHWHSDLNFTRELLRESEMWGEGEREEVERKRERERERRVEPLT